MTNGLTKTQKYFELAHLMCIILFGSVGSYYQPQNLYIGENNRDGNDELFVTNEFMETYKGYNNE